MEHAAVNNGAALKKALSDLQQKNIIERIWSGDYTIWRFDPHRSGDRLGWLNVTDWMRDQTEQVQSLVSQATQEGIEHIVLLGMGGSSLGADTLHSVLGSKKGFPDLIVVDSTIPDFIEDVSRKIEPAKTIFLVSSKSGTTVEPLSLFDHFYQAVQLSGNVGETGNNFMAITDAGSPLTDLAEKKRFRHIFTNPSDIGGRYSVLSFFGMVPAMLSGNDAAMLLERANMMRTQCKNHNPDENPGAYLGAFLGFYALHGRDKLTVITTPGLERLGLWIEQLIAESTGKQGKGILPVVDEPLLDLQSYGEDRIFIYIRMKEKADARIDNWIERVGKAGYPTLVLEMEGPLDIGAEFFRWEFATSVAGAMLGVNPFDQPDVQSAKRATEEMLRKFENTGSLPSSGIKTPPADFLSGVKKGDYVALLVYLQPSAGMDKVLDEFCKRIATRYRIATTVGYGPRYLHSTGQIHKGGPGNGHYIIVTANHHDIAIPGRPYSFGTLADAQALGDIHALQRSSRHISHLHLDGGEPPLLAKKLHEIK